MMFANEVRALRLAVIGTGALGSALLGRLAEAGVESVLLIDPDAVEDRNLPLSPFLAEAQRGYHLRAIDRLAVPMQGSKAQLLAGHAQAYFGLAWRALPCEVADVGWQVLAEVDLLCCCTDSALSRAEAAFVARALDKPVLDGAVFGDGIAEGRVTCFSPHPDAACYLCGLGEDRRADILGYAASAALGCRVPEEGAPMTGTLATLRQVANAMMAAMERFACEGFLPKASGAIKLARNAGSGTGTHADPSAALRDDKGEGLRGNKGSALPNCEEQWRREEVALTQSESCPWHGDPAPLMPLPWEQPLCASLNSIPGASVQFAWPVCTEAECPMCGGQCAPFTRVATVRKRLPCPRCGAVGLQPLRAVHRLAATDALANRSPRQLGQPDRHLYSVRCCAV